MQQVNFYPRPPRGGRPPLRVALAALRAISIHALREEGDRRYGSHSRDGGNFYPRPPRGGRQSCFLRTWQCAGISIHALREEGDRNGNSKPDRSRNFYPRPPRGGRPSGMTILTSRDSFLSTPSARRATYVTKKLYGNDKISIHALREEGDLSFPTRPRFLSNFYPRPPRGGRRAALMLRLTALEFLSTPSARRATAVGISEGAFSIFLSTPSARRATQRPLF